MVQRWLRQGVIPYHTSGGSVWFRESEIRSWADCVHMRTFTPQKPQRATGNLLVDALHRGGVFHQVRADDRDHFMNEMSALVQLPAHVNRQTLLRVLREREAMSSTGLGQGIAIPHPANPALLHLKSSYVACFFPKQPVPFEAPDQVPVHVAFLILACDSAQHLRLLGQIARSIKDPSFQSLLSQTPNEEQLSAWIANVS